MDFTGWEKLSLVDYDKKVATVLFVSRCNFRCAFCHNMGLVLQEDETVHKWDEIKSYLQKRQGILEAVVISGGEPTLMPDLEEKLVDIKSFGYLVKLDTNGTRPNVVKRLAKKGLIDYVAMDIKTSPERYPEVIKVSSFDLEPVRETVRFLLEGEVDYEFRTTIYQEHHGEREISLIGNLIKGAKRAFLQKYVKTETEEGRLLTAVPEEKAEEYRKILGSFVKEASLRGYE